MLSSINYSSYTPLQWLKQQWNKGYDQTSIFTTQGFNEKKVKALLNNHCLTILFPYARQEITDTVVTGGFPSIYLSPMNFEAIYQHYFAAASQAKTIEAIN